MFQVFCTLIVVAIVVPPAIVIEVILIIACYIYQAYYRRSSRELQRCDSLTRTPILTLFQEALSGAVPIRALGASKNYFEEEMIRIDTNQRCYTLAQYCSYWMRVRLDILGSVLVLTGAVLCVAAYDIGLPINAGKVGVCLTYIFNLTTYEGWMDRHFLSFLLMF